MDFGPDQLMTVREVASYLRVPPATVYTWHYQGEGPTVLKLGRSIRFRRRDVDAWLEDCQADHPSQRAKTAKEAQKVS